MLAISKVVVETASFDAWASRFLTADHDGLNLWACKSLIGKEAYRKPLLLTIDRVLSQSQSIERREEWLNMFDLLAAEDATSRGHAEPVPVVRVWRSRQGSAISGELIGYDLRHLRIRRSGNQGPQSQVIEVAVNQLSDWDQRFLEAYFPNGIGTAEFRELRIERDERIWTDATGTFRIVGIFKSFGGGKVTIITCLNHELKVPVQQLHEDDKEFLRQLFKKRGVASGF